MFLHMIIALTIASVMVEGFIVWNVPSLLEFYTSSNWGRLLNVSASIGLSFIMGTLFDAVGVTVFIAAMASTMISIMGFYDALLVFKRAIPRIKERKRQFVHACGQFFDLFRAGGEFARALTIFWKIITFPVTFPQYIRPPKVVNQPPSEARGL